MRVLIVDDEPIAIDRLEQALVCIPEVEIVGRAMDGRQAVALKRETNPDVVLLDINMPKLDGLSVMQNLADSGSVPEVIFVTALDQHAIRAFELHAADYLLKPVAFERLRDALRRAGERIVARRADERFAELEKLIETLTAKRRSAYQPDVWVKTRLGVDRIAVDDIDLFRAEGDYVAVESEGRVHLVKDSIGGLAERLDPTKFVRAHRSTIVNLSRVRSVRRRMPRGLSLILSGGMTVEVGPSFADDVLERLNARRWR